jgi:hypothetical protein
MRKLSAIAVCIILLLMALSLLSCGEKKTEGGEQTPSQPASSTAAKDEITAKQALELLAAKAKGWASDALPVSLGPVARGKAIEGGKCDYWSATFYSPSKKEAYIFNCFQRDVSQAGRPMFQDVVWQVGDLQGSWRVDSPEAASIAAGQGLTDISVMTLTLRQYRSDINPPQVVPSSCQVYWEIEGKDSRTLYINATTGEFLGWKPAWGQ